MSMPNSLPQMAKFYRHSGTVPAPALVAGLLVAAGFGLVGGLAYGALGLLAHLITYVKLALIVQLALFMGFGFSLGLFPTYIMKKMNARSVPIALGVTLLALVVGLYAAWVGWIFTMLKYLGKDVTLSEVANPTLLFHYVQLLFDNGIWYLIDDVMPKGWVLAGFWLAEVGILAGVSFTTSKKTMMKQVYCDACSKWGTKKDLMKLKSSDPDKVQSGLMSGDLNVLAGIPARRAGDSQWLDIYLEGCMECGDLQMLTVKSTREIPGKQGKASIKSTPIVTRMLLTPEQAIQVAQIAADVKAPAPAPGLEEKILRGTTKTSGH